MATHCAKSAYYCNAMGEMLSCLGRLPEAQKWLEQAVTLAPLYAMAYNNLGAVAFHLGEPSRAVTMLKKALIIDPEIQEARANLEAITSFLREKRA